jgi:hypothetical protein
MARYLVAYFKSALNESQIVASIDAQNWTVKANSVNNNAIDYDINPYLGFSLTVANRQTALEINGMAYPTEQSWSFRLGRSTEGDEFGIDYKAIVNLLNWITTTYGLECCFTWDGESVYVMFNRGIDYVINTESQYWADYIRPVMRSDATIQLESFEWL